MGNISGFILAGHSFGGYICGHYAVAYPQHIIKLILLSPVGIKSSETYDQEQEKLKQNPQYSNKKSFTWKVVEHAWDKQWSPFGVMRKSGSFIGSKLINRYVSFRMKNLPEEEKEVIKEYFQQIFMKDGSSEYGIFICFKKGMIAHNGLEDKERLGNPNFPVPILMIYGDRDWVYYSGAAKMVK